MLVLLNLPIVYRLNPEKLIFGREVNYFLIEYERVEAFIRPFAGLRRP